ncbi:unnamed protein product, partial [Amoebophrya sp. A25]
TASGSRPGTRGQMRSAPGGSLYGLGETTPNITHSGSGAPAGMNAALHTRQAAQEFLEKQVVAQVPIPGLQQPHSRPVMEPGLAGLRISSTVPPGSSSGTQQHQFASGGAQASSGGGGQLHLSGSSPPPRQGRHAPRNAAPLAGGTMVGQSASEQAAYSAYIQSSQHSVSSPATMSMPTKHVAPKLEDVVHNGVVGSASFVGLPGRPQSPVHGHRVISNRSPSPKGSPGHSPLSSARAKQEKRLEDLRHLRDAGRLEEAVHGPSRGGGGGVSSSGGPTAGSGSSTEPQPGDTSGLRIDGENKGRVRALEIRAKSGNDKPQMNLFYPEDGHGGVGSTSASGGGSHLLGAGPSSRPGAPSAGGGGNSQLEIRLPPLGAMFVEDAAPLDGEVRKLQQLERPSGALPGDIVGGSGMGGQLGGTFAGAASGPPREMFIDALNQPRKEQPPRQLLASYTNASTPTAASGGTTVSKSGVPLAAPAILRGRKASHGRVGSRDGSVGAAGDAQPPADNNFSSFRVVGTGGASSRAVDAALEIAR